MSTLIWYGDRITADQRRRAAVGLEKAAEYLLEQANRTVPIEEGTLARSGGTSVDAGDLAASVFYGVVYSRRQHESLNLRHANGRRAKWLELTAQERAGEIAGIIAAAVSG